MTEPTAGRRGVTPTNVSQAAYVLLGMMSLVSFGGPFALALLLHGGERSGWPPDRAVEWVGTIGLFVVFAILFTACLTVRLWLVKPMPKPSDDERPVAS